MGSDSLNGPAAPTSGHDPEKNQLLADFDNQGELPDFGNNQGKLPILRTSPASRRDHRLYFCHLMVFMVYSSIAVAMLLKVHLSYPASDREACSSRVEDKFYSAMKSAVSNEIQTGHNSVNASSPYKGPPTIAVDKAWRDLFRYSNVRITADDLRQMNRSSVQLSDGSGDFLATPDTYHQIHCLWYIFKNIHPEYYTVTPTNVGVVEHMDHCIDSLRQHVMCHATTSMQTYDWIPDLRIPWANFEVDNVCVRWDVYDGWAAKHSIDIYDPTMLVHPQLGPSFPEGHPTTPQLELGHHHAPTA